MLGFVADVADAAAEADADDALFLVRPRFVFGPKGSVRPVNCQARRSIRSFKYTNIMKHIQTLHCTCSRHLSIGLEACLRVMSRAALSYAPRFSVRIQFEYACAVPV